MHRTCLLPCSHLLAGSSARRLCVGRCLCSFSASPVDKRQTHNSYFTQDKLFHIRHTRQVISHRTATSNKTAISHKTSYLTQDSYLLNTSIIYAHIQLVHTSTGARSCFTHKLVECQREPPRACYYSVLHPMETRKRRLLVSY